MPKGARPESSPVHEQQTDPTGVLYWLLGAGRAELTFEEGAATWGNAKLTAGLGDFVHGAVSLGAAPARA